MAYKAGTPPLNASQANAYSLENAVNMFMETGGSGMGGGVGGGGAGGSGGGGGSGGSVGGGGGGAAGGGGGAYAIPGLPAGADGCVSVCHGSLLCVWCVHRWKKVSDFSAAGSPLARTFAHFFA